MTTWKNVQDTLHASSALLEHVPPFPYVPYVAR